ncbi:MAG: hypothetical protein IPK77_13780 [Cellvibrio sp.]|nr:hypothetical protein [Cellvibrio sp.]
MLNQLKCISIFFSALILSACGAERDTPFNPSGNTNSSSAASIGASVPVKEIYKYDEINPAQPVFIDFTNKQIVVASTEDEFEYYWDIYKNGVAIPTDLDFDKVQVVILDLGNIGNCTQITSYRNIRANEYSGNTVLVNFNYRESGSSSSTSSSSSASSCANLEEKRPFYFYSIESRKKILIDENVSFE